MGKSATPSFIVSLRLLPTNEDEQELEYRFRAGAHLYNLCVKEARKRAHKLSKDAEYKARRKTYSGTKEERDALFEIRARYGLAGSYFLEPYIKEGRKKFGKHLDSSTCVKTSQTVWSAIADFLFKDGKQIHFKKVRDFRSMESKSNKQGIRFRKGHVEWRSLNIPVQVRKKDVYAKQCLQNHRIKYCRIHRKWHKHKWRYYVELVMEGIPPLKERRMGKGRVGIDIGTSTIATVSEADVLFKELNDGIEPIDREIKRLNRKADRQRRANNPDNYNENGTIKRDSRSFHKRWKVSHNQKLTYDKIRELYQKRSNKLSQFQSQLANEIVAMGDEIVIETMNFQALQKKTKKTEKSKKTGRYKKKKRFGKSISIHAPSQLVGKVKRRLAYFGGTLLEIKTTKMRASQYNHITGEYMSSELSKRWKELVPDLCVQRDLYSAFLLFNVKDEETIDDELCMQTFDNFYDSHNHLIDELKQQKKEGKHFPSCMGI